MKIIDKIAEFFTKDRSSKVVINGMTYQGSNITVLSNGSVSVDGKNVAIIQEKVIEIVVHGDVDSLKTTNGYVYVSGSVNEDVSTTNGDVECGSVGGGISTVNGDILVKGSVSGSVKTTNGDIEYNK